MRIFITGANGFLGGPVADALVAAGHQVTALAFERDERPVRSPSIEIVRGDLTKPASYERALAEHAPEMLVHLAWYLNPADYVASPVNLDLVDASARLVSRALSAGCKRVVACGTCSEYATSASPLSEDAPLGPRSLYAASKAALYYLTGELCRAAGASFAWPRVFFLYGPHEARGRLVPAVIEPLLSGGRAKVSSGVQKRDYLHVEDAARGVVTAALGGASGPINVGSGEQVTVRTVVETLGTLLGGSDRIDFGTSPPRADDPPVVCADSTKLRELGWQPRFDLRSGLAATVEWYRSKEKTQ